LRGVSGVEFFVELKKAVTFLKKSNQKTFDNLDRAVFTAWGPVCKSFFASFFSKKEALAY
jgi:hypothetical protein